MYVCRYAPAAKLLVALAIFAMPSAAYAQATYYVSPSGSDSNAGTQLEPFHTIQHAANRVNPGDTVIVADGTYSGDPGVSGCGGTVVVCVGRGGTASAWVTFRAENAGGAKIDGRNNESAIGFQFQNNASYVAIDGFEIYGIGVPSGSSSSAHGIMIDVGHDVVFSRLNVHDIGRSCTDSTYGMDGMFVRVPNVTITQSTFHDIGRLSPGEQGCQVSTTNYQNHDHGLYIDGQYYSSTTPGASNVLISNDVFYRHQHGWAIQLYPGSLSSVRIENNTFAFANPYRDGQILLGAATTDAVIANNIFFSPLTDAIRYYSGTQTNLQVANNLVFNAALFSTVPSGASTLANASADPYLTDPTAEPYDFHLLSGSPAIGSGATLGDVTVDHDGVNRPAGAYDVGAYQWATVTTTSSSGSTSGTTGTSTAGTGDASAADTTAPVISFASPADGSTVRHNASFTANASDDVGVTSVEFFLDGQHIALDTAAPYSASHNFTKAASGSHIVTAVARDAAGNTASASIIVWR